jgi:hypothetical protein
LCNLCICNDCTIENHHDHIAEARFKLSDLIGLKGKEEWKAFQLTLDNSIKNTHFGKKLYENLYSHSGKMESFAKEINFSVDSIRGKLSSILDSLNNYKSVFNSYIEENLHSNNSNSFFNQLEQSKFFLIFSQENKRKNFFRMG